MQEGELRNIRLCESSKAIVFLHGFGGSQDDSWQKFPLLIASILPDWNIHTFGFATSMMPDIGGVWSADPDLEILSKRYLSAMKLPPLNSYQSLALVGHSMGGLIIQNALVKSPQLVERVNQVVLFGTPSGGLRKASWAKFWKRQLQNMAIGSDFINQLRAGWDRCFADTPPFDFRVVAGSRDQFVPTRSSLDPFPEPQQWVVIGDHLSIVKPADAESESTKVLIAALTDSPELREQPTPELDTAVTAHALPPALSVENASPAEIVKLALQLDHAGHRDKSIEVLESYDGDDADVKGTRGGRYKRMWLEDTSTLQFAEKALQNYNDGLQVAQAADHSEQIYYHAINVAFFQLVAFDDSTAAAKAAELALMHAKMSGDNIWNIATQAEAMLYLGNREKALSLYQRLPALSSEPWQLVSALQQSVIVMAKLAELSKQVHGGEEDSDLQTLKEGIANLGSTGGKLFISYSHKDEKWLKRLTTHLNGFVLNGDIEYDLWDDKRIQPGDAWAENIQQALSSATVALCLVSGNFLSSEFVRKRELPQLLEAKDKRGVHFLWLNLAPSMWDAVTVEGRKPFEELQAVWPPNPTLQELSEVEQEKALVKTAREVINAMGG